MVKVRHNGASHNNPQQECKNSHLIGHITYPYVRG